MTTSNKDVSGAIFLIARIPVTTIISRLSHNFCQLGPMCAQNWTTSNPLCTWHTLVPFAQNRGAYYSLLRNWTHNFSFLIPIKILRPPRTKLQSCKTFSIYFCSILISLKYQHSSQKKTASSSIVVWYQCVSGNCSVPSEAQQPASTPLAMKKCDKTCGKRSSTKKAGPGFSPKKVSTKQISFCILQILLLPPHPFHS